MPFSLAAIWARRSARLVSGAREGYAAEPKQLAGRGLAEGAVAYQEPVVEEHALLVDGAAEGRHGAGRDAADLGVVTARGHQEPQRVRDAVPLVEHRRHDGHVGQMCAAVVRIVDGVHVAGPHRAVVAAQHFPDGLPHGAEVHRDVRCVGDQVAVRVEEGAGEVEPLLDVDGVGGVLQAHAHLLGDGHEEVVEDLQHDRVDPGADGLFRGARACAGQDQMAGGGEGGLPAGVDDGGRAVLGDDGRACHGVRGPQVRPAVKGGILPAVPGEHPCGVVGLRSGGPAALRSGWSRCGMLPRRTGRLDGDRLDDQRPVHREAVA